jgi:hypothetical protein
VYTLGIRILEKRYRIAIDDDAKLA